MRDNSVVIATTAGLFADILGEKLRDAYFNVSIAATAEDLAVRVRTAFPKFVFIEHCFYGIGTDAFIQRMAKRYRAIHIAVWAVSELKPIAAARFIHAGAESFFSMRETNSKIDNALCLITGGRRYCPANVEAFIKNERSYPVIGKEFTGREIDILKLLADGYKNKDIAEALSVSVHSVRFHRGNINRKCGGNPAGEILRYGMERGIIPVETF